MVMVHNCSPSDTFYPLESNTFLPKNIHQSAGKNGNEMQPIQVYIGNKHYGNMGSGVFNWGVQN